MNRKKIATTKRLILRMMEPNDVDSILQIVSDPETMTFYPAVLNRTETERYVQRNLARYHRDGLGLWVVRFKDTNEFAGICGLVVQTVDEKREIEIGYLFLRKYWGQGLATEAAIACRDYGFRKRGFSRLISIIAPGNIASRRVAEKAGMKLEKETIWQDKRVCIYAIEKKDSTQRRSGLRAKKKNALPDVR